MPLPAPLSAADRAAFERLQEGLADQFRYAFPNRMAPKTVVIVPSLTLDPEILSKVKGQAHYEERMLCLLLLLRMPRTQVIYVSSTPIDEEIVDYYLHLLPGITGLHARKRLTMLCCYDASNQSLTDKMLARPRLIERIRSLIPPTSAAHMVGFIITPKEEELALRLGLPIFGCPSWLEHWGSKSGSREIFRRAGVSIPPGYENIRNMDEALAALQALKHEYPQLRKAVVKLNDGFSGDGNSIYSYERHGVPQSEEDLRRNLVLVASDLAYSTFAEKMTLMGGIVEAFIDGEQKTSPSVQCRITPLHEIEVLSTHDQVLGGESGQVYLGATFPADAEYRREIGELGFRISSVMNDLGVIGRFGVDFVSVKEPGGWKHYAIEINLRKGGTTHPYLMLQFLTDGTYDYASGEYRMANGQTRYYFTTDGLCDDAYKSLTPPDLIDVAICHGLHFNGATQDGVTFHLIGALSEHGKLGVLCVGKTPEAAMGFYEKTVAALDKETKGR